MQKVTAAKTKVSRIDRLWRVIVTGAALCALPHTAQAQLRSFHAIRYVTLAPPPLGMEKLHQDLADVWRKLNKLVEAPETFDERLARVKAFDKYEAASIDPRSHCARCRLRGDLPQPRAIGLECADYAGKYVGVVRFSTADEAQRWFTRNLPSSYPAARPLNTIPALASGQSTGHNVSIKDIEFMKRLLRTNGTFTVLDSTDGLSEGELESVVYFDVNPYSYSDPDTTFTNLELKDRYGNWVRGFMVARPRRMGLVYRISFEEVMRRMVDQVFKARLEDEEIYRMPPLK